MARIEGTSEGSAISGVVWFEDTNEGLKISAELKGVPEGAHGFHIHEFGSCEDSGRAAGNHYNPRTSHHGHVLKDGVKKAHAGDLGNIKAGPDGRAAVSIVIPKLALSNGKFAVAGRAVILHEKEDDFSQPSGNAGGRIGCGVIAISPSR
ncbi:MAG: superoxide dismutase family protein [Elusimicrobia bacterium]|nr:superoxide dismutase family protein [Elusimicrobiota bacterium]